MSRLAGCGLCGGSAVLIEAAYDAVADVQFLHGLYVGGKLVKVAAWCTECGAFGTAMPGEAYRWRKAPVVGAGG